MNRIIFSALLLCLIIACTNKRIVQPADYNTILSDDKRIEGKVQETNAEINFWKKRLAADTGNYVDMMELASHHTRRFKFTGDANDLHLADSFHKRVLAKVKNTEPDIYFSLSQNAITQHRFRDAWRHLLFADSIGANPFINKFLNFDAGMEIGLYRQASLHLNEIRDKKGFDYLIRKAKLEDHRGNPDKAIKLMELALREAEESGRKPMILWSKSNLADMYGHAGRVKESYQYYLDVLQMDSSYLYALKGIAWIAYSHDHNAKEAKHILHYILSQTNMPDLYLMLAEIAGWEGDEETKKQNLSTFLTEVQKPGYGDMYNKYLISIYAEELKDYYKALALAKKEVNNRPTAETYNWLAWVYFQKGDIRKAHELMKSYVIGRTFEPDAQLHAAFIFEAAGDKVKAKKLFSECFTANFELGPVARQEIIKRLNDL